MGSSLFLTPAPRMRGDLLMTQELVEIETNPLPYLSTRIEVLGKGNDNFLDQPNFV